VKLPPYSSVILSRKKQSNNHTLLVKLCYNVISFASLQAAYMEGVTTNPKTPAPSLSLSEPGALTTATPLNHSAPTTRAVGPGSPGRSRRWPGRSVCGRPGTTCAG